MAVLLAALACGCSSDDAEVSGGSSGSTQISFVLKVSGSSESTRAAWSEGYDSQDGTDYENRISPDDLKVALYNESDGQFAANVNILTYYETADGEYEFIGSVDNAPQDGNYKVMVFANCGDVNLSDLSDYSPYQYVADDVKDGTQLIPMWGVTTAPLSFEKGERSDVGTIDLLRAFAKVEINLDDNIKDNYMITSATLTRYNTKGYCLPAGYADVSATTELDQEDEDEASFNPYSDEQSTDLAFSYSDDGKSAYVYIPEYDNSASDATISLELSDGTDGTLEFKDYNTDGTATGEAHDIVRNHIYRYTVDVYQGKLTVEAAVMPWQLVESSIGWKPTMASTTEDPFATETSYEEFVAKGSYILLPGAAYSVNTDDEDEDRSTTQKLFSYLYEDASEGDAEAKYNVLFYPRYDDDDRWHRMLEYDTGGATFYFMLTGPEGATWEAHLTNTEDFYISTGTSNYFANNKDDGFTTEDVRKVSHGIAREQPYVVQVNVWNAYSSPQTEDNKYPELSADSEDWKAYFDDNYLTEWGKDKWYGHKVVDTEFYITVKLTDGTEYELTINPSYGSVVKNTNYKDNRRYAGTDTRIWIRQLRAQYNKGYDYLANDDGEEWWQVNPYWDD